MPIFELLTASLALPPIYYASTFFHELGHALMGRAVGFVVTSFGLGTSRPWCVVRFLGMRTFFCSVRPFQGVTFLLVPELYPSRGQMVSFAAAGILSNGILAAFALALWRWLPWGGSVWLTAAAVNGLLAGLCLIPFHFKVGNASLATDGMLILETLRSGTVQATAPMIVQSLRLFRGLWKAIGDDLTLRCYLLASAVAYVYLEDCQHAERLRLEAESLPAPIMPALRAYDSVLRAAIALGTSRLEDAALALDAAEVNYRSMGHEVALLHVASLRASARALRGDALGASADLEALMSNPLMERHPSLKIALLAECLIAHAAMSDMPAVEKLLEEYKGARRRQGSLVLDRMVYKTVAHLHAQRGDWVRAEPACRKLVSAIADIASAWTDPDEQLGFLQSQAAIFAEARQCLESLGKAEEAKQLVEVSASLAGIQHHLVEARRQRDRRFRRTGLSVTLVNVASIAGSYGLAQVVGTEMRLPSLLLGALLGILTIPGILYILFDVTIGRLFPMVNRSGGAVILLLACLPWLSVFLLLLIALLVSSVELD
jgi:hypothetical protein